MNTRSALVRQNQNGKHRHPDSSPQNNRPRNLMACLRRPAEDLHILIAKRAYDLYGERGYRHGSALDDWLEAERRDSQ